MKIKDYVTNLSKHCYYGNISNILNSYGISVSEAELVLLSNALNCTCIYESDNLFFGIPNEKCSDGLKKLNCTIVDIAYNDERILSTYKNILKQGFPVLLLINSGILSHNELYKGTNENHYIVLISENFNKLLISDSFIPTIPHTTTFQGYIDYASIYKELVSGQVEGVFLRYDSYYSDYHNQLQSSLIQYLDQNIFSDCFSVIELLRKYVDVAVNNKSTFLNRETLLKLSYDINVAGMVARFDYLIYLFSKYLQIDDIICIEILELKKKWNIISNKLKKCSLRINEDYYLRIFLEDIPALIEKEIAIYKIVRRLEQDR